MKLSLCFQPTFSRMKEITKKKRKNMSRNFENEKSISTSHMLLATSHGVMCKVRITVIAIVAWHGVHGMTKV